MCVNPSACLVESRDLGCYGSERDDSLQSTDLQVKKIKHHPMQRIKQRPHLFSREEVPAVLACDHP